MLSLEMPLRFITPAGEPDHAEARALSRLRAGSLEGAAAYLRHKQLTGTVTALERTPALKAATAWHAKQIASGADPTRIALIARSHHLRAILKARARESMRAAGLLGPDTQGLAEIPLALGDVVVCRRNDVHLGVANGARGRVREITPNTVVLAMTDDRVVRLPRVLKTADETHRVLRRIPVSVTSGSPSGRIARLPSWAQMRLARGALTVRLTLDMMLANGSNVRTALKIRLHR